MPHISDLAPEPGERHGIFGGTRAGKSAFQDWSLRHIQLARPDAMQILVDTKPRFRAEHEKGFRPGWRKDASHRYTTWAKGPIVPNSVVVDLWDDKPFRGTFDEPGEIVILQSGEERDWRRMLELLDGFVKANIAGRERRIVVDECLDFTSETHTVSIRAMTYSSVRPEQEVSEISELILALTKSKGCHVWSAKCYRVSRFSTCGMMRQTCDISMTSESWMRLRQMETMCFVNGACNRAERSRFHSLGSWCYQTRIYPNSQQHRRGGGQ